MDLINQRFGELVVTSIVDGFACQCQCSCGKSVRVSIMSLVSGTLRKCVGHRSKAKKYWYKGSSYTTAEIEAKFGVSRQTFLMRVTRGLSVRAAIEKSVFKPVAKPPREIPPLQTWPHGELQLTLAEIHELSKSGLKLSKQTLRARLKQGWSVEEALTIPPQTPRPGTVTVHGHKPTRGTRYEYPTGSGQTYCMRQLAQLAGVTINSVKWRLSLGWSIDRIVETPAYTAKRAAEVRSYDYRGGTYTISQLAKIGGLSVPTLRTRIRNNWSIEDAVETPVYKGAKHATHRDTTTSASSLGDSLKDAA